MNLPACVGPCQEFCPKPLRESPQGPAWGAFFGLDIILFVAYIM